MLKRIITTLALVIVCILIFIQTSHAQQGVALTTTTSQAAILVPFDDEAITIDATAGGVGFTASKINPTCTGCLPGSRRAQLAYCVSEAATGINFRASVTSTVVTASVGSLFPSGTSLAIYGYTAISQFKAIRTAGTSVAMYCTYYRTS